MNTEKSDYVSATLSAAMHQLDTITAIAKADKDFRYEAIAEIAQKIQFLATKKQEVVN